MKKLLIISILFLGFQYTIAQSSNENKSKTIPTSQKVKVFPNPATNVVNVLGLMNTTTATIAISDIYGSVVLKHQWEIKNKALNIPIANLKKGIYLISIRSDKQTVQTKFYKQ